MERDIVIQVNDLSKIYKLYNKPIDRLKESLGIAKKKNYTEHYALNHVSFQVERGEAVGIIGTNGSGKSTILKIITGVLNQTSGEVKVNGRISALLELGAGFNPEYSGLENVYLNGTMIGFSKQEIDEKLQEILDFADIGDFIHQPVKTYSSGMFVRLAFAVAINIEPEILIVDEALSVGDVFFQAKCYHKFEEFRKKGKTLLLVTHDLGSVAKYCNRVILLNKGNKVAEGRPKEIIDMYKKILVGVDKEEPKEKEEEANAIEQKQMDGSDTWKSYMLVNPEVSDYGNKKAEIIDYGVFDEQNKITNTVYKMKDFYIKMKIRFNTTIENPIFAFSIKDLKGTELTGTNTVIEKVDTGYRKAGEIVKIAFKQKMILQGGQYLLQLGCTGYEGDKLVVYHRLYDVCCIQNIGDKTTVGYFDMDSQVELL